MRASTLSALLLAPLLVLSGCGANGAAVSVGTSTNSSTGTSSGTSTLAFTGTTVDGNAFDGASLAGKPTVLWFWAPWCSTCRAQAGGVADLAQRFEGKVNVVGVGGLSEDSDVRAFAEKVVGPTHLMDNPGEVWRHFGVTAQSTYVVLDADGKIVEKGYLDDDALVDKVEQLVS